jgi:hypothetical protein
MKRQSACYPLAPPTKKVTQTNCSTQTETTTSAASTVRGSLPCEVASPPRPSQAPGFGTSLPQAVSLLTAKRLSTPATWQQIHQLYASGARSKAPILEKARPPKPPCPQVRTATTKAAFALECRVKRLQEVSLQQALEDAAL